MFWSAWPACSTALAAMRLDSCTWRPISCTDEVISSAAAATDCTLSDIDCAAAIAEFDIEMVVSEVLVSVPAEASSSTEAPVKVEISSPIAVSNSVVARPMRSARAVLAPASTFASSSARFFSISACLNTPSAEATLPISVRGDSARDFGLEIAPRPARRSASGRMRCRGRCRARGRSQPQAPRSSSPRTGSASCWSPSA